MATGSLCKQLNILKNRNCRLLCTKTCSTLLSNKNNIENDKNWKQELLKTMKIYPDFINKDEEESLFQEVEPYMKKLRYEFDHWDDV